MDTSGVTDPAFLTALATLITAFAALIKLFQAEGQRDKQTTKLDRINEQTNGTLTALHDTVATLKSTQATTEELAARAAKTITPLSKE